MGERGLAKRSTCVLCDVDVDPRRDSARVVDGRVQSICPSCAAGPAQRADSSRPGGQRDEARAGIDSRRGACSACGDAVALHRLRPMVTAGGSIASLCPACVEARDRHESAPAGQTQQTEGQSPGKRDVKSDVERVAAIWRGGWRRYGLAAVAAMGLAIMTASARDRVPTAAVASSFAPAARAVGHAGDGNPGARLAAMAVPAELGTLLERPGAAPGDRDEPDDSYRDEELEDPGVFDNELPPAIEDALERGDEPMEERLPTLLDWVYPVAGSDESFPLKPTRRFGAQRDRVRRTDCGRGHCGVDLDGPRGTPVVAVAWGQVMRVERRSGRSSGKYVRIEHPDYVYTSYMHLDSIADGLKVGDEVQPGDFLGTLGRTGIRHSDAHLHFSLEIPAGERFVHLDPTPYLRKAARIDEPATNADDE